MSPRSISEENNHNVLANINEAHPARSTILGFMTMFFFPPHCGKIQRSAQELKTETDLFSGVLPP